MSKKFSLTAVKFRLALSVALVVILGGAVAIAVFGYRILSERASETNEVVQQAATSEERISTIQRNAVYLEENRNIVERTRQVVAESQQYMYQNVLVNDLRRIASKSGIVITNFDFSTETATPEAPQAPAADDELGAEEGGDTEVMEMEESSTPTGPALKTSSVNITIQNPVGYTQLLNFLHHIEQNLTKMQVSKVNLSRATEGNSSGNQVTTEALTIEVFIR